MTGGEAGAVIMGAVVRRRRGWRLSAVVLGHRLQRRVLLLVHRVARWAVRNRRRRLLWLQRRRLVLLLVQAEVKVLGGEAEGAVLQVEAIALGGDGDEAGALGGQGGDCLLKARAGRADGLARLGDELLQSGIRLDLVKQVAGREGGDEGAIGEEAVTFGA